MDNGNDRRERKVSPLAITATRDGFRNRHRPGIVHNAADALSRLPTDGEDTSPLEDDIPVLAVSRQATTRSDFKILADDESDLEDYRNQPDNNSQDEPNRERPS